MFKNLFFVWLSHQNYKVCRQCILLYRSMSSIAFCKATSGFSVPVDTNKLRTATARSFAIIVGLPTCELISSIHCAIEGAKLAMRRHWCAYKTAVDMPTSKFSSISHDTAYRHRSWQPNIVFRGFHQAAWCKKRHSQI